MRVFLSLLVVVALYCAVAAAQSPDATVTGRVLDPTKALVSHATVTVVNQETNVKHASETNEEGIYVVPNLKPGTYRIEISKQGFKTILRPDVVLHVQDVAAINFELALGSVSESVTVQGGAPLVNTENAAVSTVIDRNFVEKLPLNGRSFNTLLQLTPGVVIAPSDNGGGNPGQFSIAGQRTDSNNFSVDGASVNFGVSVGTGGLGNSGTGEAQAFSVVGGTSSLVSVDALQEFRIETSSYAPEFGRSPGGQVILTTRSGTNAFHGGVFEYFRNDVMDANDWFANHAGKSRAAEHHNDFGGFFGGPIFKDKTFFFVSYEGALLRLPQTQVTQVPSAYARLFATTNAPTLAPFLNAYPKPDDNTVTPGVYSSPFTGSWSNSVTLNAGSVRIDHVFNDRLNIFGRFNYAPSQAVTRPGVSLNTVDTTMVDTQTLTFGLNFTVSPKISNSVRANYSTQGANDIRSLDTFGGAVLPNNALFLGTLSQSNTEVLFSNDDISANPLNFGPIGNNHATQLNVVDDLSVTKGRHQFKLGGDYRAIFTTVKVPQNALSYSTDTVQAFLGSGQAFLFAVTTASTQFVTHALSLYAQDTWRATPRLALTYGVRWELDPAPSARGATDFAAWQNVNTPSQLALASAGTPLWNTTYGNFAPRVGLAYSLTSNGDFVFRAGWGLFYDLGAGQAANLSTTFPNVVSSGSVVTLPVANLTPFLPSISLQPPFSGEIHAFSPNLTLPRSYQWNVALEKSFGGRQAVSATYVAQAGRDLLRQQGLAAPNSNFGPFTRFFITQNDATSNYNALQLQYRNSLSSRLQVLLNYTWSHSIDDASSDIDFAPANAIVSNKNDRGSSSFDVRHSFSGALSFNVPAAAKSGPLFHLTRDWSLDAVIVSRSGFPFNALALFRRLGPAVARPDLIPGQPIWIAEAGAPGGKVLNPLAFSTPPTIRQGTEGRNGIPGFGLTQVDFSVGRKLSITERFRVQFRADAFNLFNHPNFSNPLGIFINPFVTPFLQSQRMANVGLGGLSPLFQEGGPRSLQLSLKLLF
jgi:hypothetical protein